jgi:hypothetical protein
VGDAVEQAGAVGVAAAGRVDHGVGATHGISMALAAA